MPEPILQSKLNQMVSQCENADASEVVKKFAEELRYSDPDSSDTLAGSSRTRPPQWITCSLL